MTFDEIMQEITGGLTGDTAKDFRYLQEQMEEYRNHELSREILRECGRRMYELLPDDLKKELDKNMDRDRKKLDDTLDRIRFHVYKKDFQKANSLTDKLVRKIESLPMFESDQISDYYTFHESFEEMLYRKLIGTEKELRRASIPYDEIYALQGSILIDLKDIKGAQNALARAFRWNPARAEILYEYAETCKLAGDMETFLRKTKKALKLSFRPQTVARGFRNLGYYFSEKELYEEAAACIYLSLPYDSENTVAQSELYYISQKSGQKLTPPTEDFLKSTAEKYGIETGPNPEILNLAYAAGSYYYTQKQWDAARYYLDILYSLTDDEDIRKMLEKIQE